MTWARPTGPDIIVFTSAARHPACGGARPSRGLGAADDVGWLYGLRTDDRVLHAGAFNWTYTLGTGLMDPWRLGQPPWWSRPVRP